MHTDSNRSVCISVHPRPKFLKWHKHVKIRINPGFTLEVNEMARIDAQVEVSALSESVTVTRPGQLLQTRQHAAHQARSRRTGASNGGRHDVRELRVRAEAAGGREVYF